MDAEGYTERLDAAVRALAGPIHAEREHVAAVALQIIVASNLGEDGVVNALARMLKSESEGGWQDDYPAIWAVLQG